MPVEFQHKYESTHGPPIWHGVNPSGSIGLLTRVLDSNPEIPPYTQGEVCAWAQAQWCAAAPDRCKASSKKLKASAAKKAHNVFEAMDWAPEFWRTWNVAVSDFDKADDQAQNIMTSFVEAAFQMLTGSFGCPECLDHFRGFVNAFPLENIFNFRQARVWLWKAHNDSKSEIPGFVPVPYSQIALIYDWELLSDAEVSQVINQELRA